MRSLSAYDVVRITEWGHDKHAIDRALVLLRVAAPERTPEQLAALSIGRRDALLLALRRATFGSALAVRVPCPSCGERMEFSVSVEQLLIPAPPQPDELTLEHDGWVIRYRLVDSRDLAAVIGIRDPALARRRLFARCVLAVQGRDGAAAAELTPEVEAAVSEAMSAADPQADLRFALRCPTQQHEFVAVLDILSVFWKELRQFATRVESDVDEIARVYGWSEETILSMSAQRRARYVALASRG